jgi:hypothetical protein
MSLARVVTFDGVTKDRAAEMREEMSGDKPEGLPATEFMLLHDPATDQATAILFFANEEDYATGDAFLNAMPASDTPGKRTSVTRHDVIIRMAD